MPSFRHDDLALHYAVSGPAGSTPIVFFHGLSATQQTWDEVVTAFDSAHRCWRLDFRGHGESARAPGRYTFNGYADDAVAFVEHAVAETGGGPAIVVGHSLGAVSAYLVAHRRPDLVKAVLLEDPPLYTTRPEVFSTTFAALMFPMLRDTAKQLQASGLDAESVKRNMAAQPAGFTSGTNGEVFSDADLTSRAHGMLALDTEAFDVAIDCTMSDQDEDAPVSSKGRLLRGEKELGCIFWPEHVARFEAAAPNIAIHQVAGTAHFVHGTRRDVATFLDHLAAVIAD